MAAVHQSVWSRYRQSFITLLIIIFLLGAGAAWWQWSHRPIPSGKSQADQAVSVVSKLMVLPSGETPTLAVVKNADKLKSQTFFKHAQDNDEVLIYVKNQLSILYRPSINKIINVGPVIANDTGSAYVTSTIAIKNGSGSPAALQAMVQKTKRLFPHALIEPEGNASRTYAKTIIIDVTKKQQTLAEQLADSLRIVTGQLPLNEPISNTDFLIIIGQDFR